MTKAMCSQERRQFSKVHRKRQVHEMRMAGAKHMTLAVALLCLTPAVLADCLGNVCTVQMEGLVTKGACEFDFKPTLSFDEVVPADFMDNGGTAQIKTFSLTLNKCVGPEGGTSRAGVSFLGATLIDSGVAPVDAIFSEDVNGAVGFMFRAGKFTGPLADFRKNDNAVVVKNQPATWDDDRFTPGVVPVDGTTVEYTAGFVWNGNGTIPENTNVKALVTFAMNYR